MNQETPEPIIERLPPEDLAAMVAQQTAARLAALQAQLEETKFTNVLLAIRLKHYLSEADSVNTTTGVITRG